MLVLTRKPGERIHIGETIVLSIVRIQGGRVRIGIEAPAQCRVLRAELIDGRPLDEIRNSAARRPVPA